MFVRLLAINYPNSYTYEPWHVTLFVMAVASAAFLFNTLLAQRLPLIEGIILIVHCFGFFGILIPLWVLAPSVPASEVFGSIKDRGGWGNDGVACLVGLTGPLYALIDMPYFPVSCQISGTKVANDNQGLTRRSICVCPSPSFQSWRCELTREAEKIRDSSRVLPLGMVWALILNGSTGFIMIVTFAFCVGDIDKVMETKTGFAFIQVFLNATGSVRAASGMTSVIIVMQFCAAISNVATTSRQIYAFARDKGLPFSSTLAKVSFGSSSMAQTY